MKIKKVLFVCSVYKPNVGGVETIINELCKHYSKKGIETVVLTKRFPFDLPTYKQDGQTKIFRFQRPIKIADYIETSKWLKKINKEIKADVVHLVGTRRPMPLVGLLLAKKWGVPFIVNFIGGDLPDEKDSESVKIWKENNGTVEESVMKADKLISFSHFINRIAVKTFKKDLNIKVIYAGIDLNRIAKIKKVKKEYKYFLSARRMYKDKGLDILIKAFKNIKTNLDNTKLVLIGDGPEKDNLLKLIKKLSLTKDIIFLGKTSPSVVFSYMKGAVAHICPSRTEGGGTVNFEAQAAKCLAIGSNAGGIPEYIINNKTGLLFESENIKGLSEKLILALNSKLRQKITKNAFVEIQKYSWNKIARQYVSEYENSHSSKQSRFKPWSEISDKMWRYLN